MLSINKKFKLTTCAVVITQALVLNQAYAAVMDFDNPPMPAAVFGGFGESYVQGGLENTSIKISMIQMHRQLVTFMARNPLEVAFLNLRLTQPAVC